MKVLIHCHSVITNDSSQQMRVYSFWLTVRSSLGYEMSSVYLLSFCNACIVAKPYVLDFGYSTVA